MQKHPTEQILRLRTVLSRTGLSRSLTYDLIQKGDFPKPIQLGARAVGWLESEVENWITAKIMASRAPVDPAA
jgi:prophage regulatory protein